MRKFKPGTSFPDQSIRKYRYLKGFSLQKHYPGFEAPSTTLEIVITDSPDDDAPGLTFTFFGVTDLRAGDLNSCTASSLQILDISSRQLDGVSFQVKDVEDAWFTLNCDDLEVRARTLQASNGSRVAEAVAVAR